MDVQIHLSSTSPENDDPIETEPDLSDTSGNTKSRSMIEENESNNSDEDNPHECCVCVPDALARLAFLFALRPGSPPESESESPTCRGDPSVIDLIIPLAGILLWIIDIGTDIYVAHKAYRDYGTAWGHTLSFLLLSSVIVVYILHIRLLCYETKGLCGSIKAYPVLLLGPPSRSMLSFWLAWKDYKAKVTNVRILWLSSQGNLTVLLLFEAILEACPQLVIQIHLYMMDTYKENGLIRTGHNNETEGGNVTILDSEWLTSFPVHFNQSVSTSEKLDDNFTVMASTSTPIAVTIDVIQLLSIIVSVMALAWAVVAFTKSRRLFKHSQEVEPKRACYGKVMHFIQDTLCMFLWRFCTVGSRVIVWALAFRLILQCFSHSILYGVIITISAMGSLLTPFVISKMYDVIVVGIMAFVMLNILDCVTLHYQGVSARQEATWYYCIDFILRFVMVITWYVMIPIKDDHAVTVLLVFSSVLFVMGLIFMVVHYTCCHENKEKIKEDTKERIENWSWVQCRDILTCIGTDNRGDYVDLKCRVIHIILLPLLTLVVAVIVSRVLPWHL